MPGFLYLYPPPGLDNLLVRDRYVKVTVSGVEQKTKVMAFTLEPVYEVALQLPVVEPMYCDTIDLSIFDADAVGPRARQRMLAHTIATRIHNSKFRIACSPCAPMPLHPLYPCTLASSYPGETLCP